MAMASSFLMRSQKILSTLPLPPYIYTSILKKAIVATLRLPASSFAADGELNILLDSAYLWSLFDFTVYNIAAVTAAVIIYKYAF